jgi:hypothetical protein
LYVTPVSIRGSHVDPNRMSPKMESGETPPATAPKAASTLQIPNT